MAEVNLTSQISANRSTFSSELPTKKASVKNFSLLERIGIAVAVAFATLASLFIALLFKETRNLWTIVMNGSLKQRCTLRPTQQLPLPSPVNNGSGQSNPAPTPGTVATPSPVNNATGQSNPAPTPSTVTPPVVASAPSSAESPEEGTESMDLHDNTLETAQLEPIIATIRSNSQLQTLNLNSNAHNYESGTSIDVSLLPQIQPLILHHISLGTTEGQQLPAIAPPTIAAALTTPPNPTSSISQSNLASVISALSHATITPIHITAVPPTSPAELIAKKEMKEWVEQAHKNSTDPMTLDPSYFLTQIDELSSEQLNIIQTALEEVKKAFKEKTSNAFVTMETEAQVKITLSIVFDTSNTSSCKLGNSDVIIPIFPFVWTAIVRGFCNKELSIRFLPLMQPINETHLLVADCW